MRTWRNRLFSLMDIVAIQSDFFLSTFKSLLTLRFQGATVGESFKTSGKCFFKARAEGSICIGNNITLLAGHRTNRVGMVNPVLIETFGDGYVELGDNTGASSVVISSRSRIVIGKRCKIGGNVRIFDHDFHSLDFEVRRSEKDSQHVESQPINIGNDVFIGTNAIILKGVSIGERSIVASGSIVTKSIPVDQVWGGNPAKFIRNLET